MATVSFPNPSATNPDTGLTYGEGWTNPANDITYAYNNGVWSAVTGPGPQGVGIFVDVDGDHMVGDLTLGLQDGTVKTTIGALGAASFGVSVDAPSITVSGAPVAIEAYVDNAVSDLVAGSPALLNTLDELAAAIGDDPNFISTVNAQISDAALAQNFTFDASLVPVFDSLFDLGSPTHRIRDLYLSDTSIEFASGALSIVGGKMQFGGVDIADANDVAEVNTDITDIVAALGIGENVTNMGTFVSTRLPDASNLRDVLENFASEYDTRVTSVDASLALLAPLADPALTGTPTAPTAVAGTNTTQLATTAFVTGAVADLIDGAPGAIDTLNELAAALGDDPNFATTVTNSIATKLDASAVSAFGLTLVDDADAATARTTLGLGTAATTASTDYATAAQGTTADAALPASSVSAFGLTLVDDVDAAAARTTLGLGTAATTASTDYATAAQGATADAALAASAVSAFGLTLVDDVDAATARTTLGLGTAATTASTDYATAAQGATADAALPAAGAQAALSVDHLITLSGVAESSDDLGTFTGSVIADNVTIKAALQALETAVEGAGGDSVADLRSFVGGNAGDTHLGTMIGNVVTDGVSVKTALNELVIRIEDHEDGTTNFTSFQLAGTVVTATGAELNVLDGVTATTAELNYTGDLGTFTGTTISDNLDVKAAIQEIETAIETADSNSGGNLASSAFNFSTTTTAGANSGQIRFDNATPGSVTNIYMSDTNKAGVDLTNIIPFLLNDNSKVYVQVESDAGAYLSAVVNGTPTDNGNYFTIPVDGVTAGTLPGNNAKVIFAVVGEDFSTYAPLASPALTGTPTAPTAAVNTNTTQLATTAFVVAEVSNELADTANAASMRTALGITENAGDPADGRGLYYDTSASKYLLSS